MASVVGRSAHRVCPASAQDGLEERGTEGEQREAEESNPAGGAHDWDGLGYLAGAMAIGSRAIVPRIPMNELKKARCVTSFLQRVRHVISTASTKRSRIQ